MHSSTARRRARGKALSRAQYSELRTDLETELRRLAPDAERTTGIMLQDLAPRSRRRALQIIEVLRRMDAGSFGVCASCQRPIPYERLSAIPETTVCVRCSRSRELAFQG